MTIRARLIGFTSALLLSAALLTGCSDSENGNPGTGETPTSGANPPAGIPLADVPGTKATANGKTAEMGIGTYCWTQMCVDKIGPVTKGTLDVSRDDIVEVALPQGTTAALREVSAMAFRASTPVQGDNGDHGVDSRALGAGTDGIRVEVDVDLPPGSWILAVGMYFERGDVSYGLVLDVR